MIELVAANASRSSQGETMAKGIFTRGDILWIRKRVDGKLYRYSTGKKDTKQNRKWVSFHFERLWDKLHQRSSQQVLSNDNVTVAEYGRHYFRTLPPDSRDSKQHERLRNDFEKYVVPFLGNIALADLRASEIQEWQTKIKYYPDRVPDIEDLDRVPPRRGPSRVRNIRHTLTLVLSDAVRNQIISSSPATHVPVEKEGRLKKRTFSVEEAEQLSDEDMEDIYIGDKISTFSEADIERLMSVCDEITLEKPKHFRYTWTVFKWHMFLKFYTGMRSGEALALMWRNVDFKRRRIKVTFTMRDGELKAPKSGKVREIDILPQAEVALKKLRELTGHSRWVILKRDGETPYYNPYGPSKLWSQVLERAGFKKVRWYNTRHSFVTNMLNRGLNPEWVIQQVGHESIVITRQHYEGRIEPEWDKLENGLSKKVSQSVSHLEDLVS